MKFLITMFLALVANAIGCAWACWTVGEVLLDWHDFDLPRDLAIGSYQIVVVLRNADTGVTLGETFISPLSVVN